ncbi:kinase-associated lipoprotein B [Bacillus tianshenii]|nr:kinase-associated lipoprotein B [Bacillus tianshenii]
MQTELQIGDVVTGMYKTGKYIGEITDIRPRHYLVRILAVLKHPQQGDLHNPQQADVPLFHERKALAYREQTNMLKQQVKPYEEEVPPYDQSLRQALDEQLAKLKTEETLWAERSITNLKELEKEYFSS